MANPIDFSKLRIGAEITVHARVVNKDAAEPRLKVVVGTEPVWLQTKQIVDVHSQPFEPEDRIRFYPGNKQPTYECGRFVDYLGHRGEGGQALIRVADDKLKIAFVSELIHENTKDPSA